MIFIDTKRICSTWLLNTSLATEHIAVARRYLKLILLNSQYELKKVTKQET